MAGSAGSSSDAPGTLADRYLAARLGGDRREALRIITEERAGRAVPLPAHVRAAHDALAALHTVVGDDFPIAVGGRHAFVRAPETAPPTGAFVCGSDVRALASAVEERLVQ